MYIIFFHLIRMLMWIIADVKWSHGHEFMCQDYIILLFSFVIKKNVGLSITMYSKRLVDLWRWWILHSCCGQSPHLLQNLSVCLGIIQWTQKIQSRRGSVLHITRCIPIRLSTLSEVSIKHKRGQWGNWKCSRWSYRHSVL